MPASMRHLALLAPKIAYVVAERKLHLISEWTDQPVEVEVKALLNNLCRNQDAALTTVRTTTVPCANLAFMGLTVGKTKTGVEQINRSIGPLAQFQGQLLSNR